MLYKYNSLVSNKHNCNVLYIKYLHVLIVNKYILNNKHNNITNYFITSIL